MRQFLVLLATVFSIAFFSCDNEDCVIEKKVLSTGAKRKDPVPGNQYYGETVLSLNYAWLAKVESGKWCKGSTCLKMVSFQAVNISPKDMELTLDLTGRGEHVFKINQGDTVQISPLPDYCPTESWGSIKHIEYK